MSMYALMPVSLLFIVNEALHLRGQLRRDFNTVLLMCVLGCLTQHLFLALGADFVFAIEANIATA
jgi:hypothetical protein